MSSGIEKENNMVMACPICGTPALFSCLRHPQEDRTEEMPISRAIALMDEYIERLASQVSEAEENRQQLLASMMDWDT